MKKSLLLALSVTLLLCGCWQTEAGQKTGTIVKITKQGLYWQTYEGELVRGGFDNGSGANGRSFDFSFGLFSKKNVEKAKQLMESNKPVILEYHCEAWAAPWRGNHDCFVDNIREHKK